jgi:hypothetical protein
MRWVKFMMALTALVDDNITQLVTLYTARINGSVNCFSEAWQRWHGDDDLPKQCGMVTVRNA